MPYLLINYNFNFILAVSVKFCFNIFLAIRFKQHNNNYIKPTKLRKAQRIVFGFEKFQKI